MERARAGPGQSRFSGYYSVGNWRWRGFWNPQGYPDELPQIAWRVYDQVRELMPQYGKLDIL